MDVRLVAALTTPHELSHDQEGETVIRSDSEGSDASAVIAVGSRQQTTADGEEHERLLSLYISCRGSST